MRKLNSEILLSQIISFIANPFLVIVPALIISNLEALTSDLLGFTAFLIIGGIPSFLTYIYQLHKEKKSQALKLVSIPRELRSKVYLSAIIGFSIDAIIFRIIQNFLWFYHSLLFSLFAIALYLVNKYIDKASMHAAGFAFAVLYLAGRVNIAFSILFVFLPIIYFARIKLHKHTWLQLFLGTTIGMIFGLLSWTIV